MGRLYTEHDVIALAKVLGPCIKDVEKALLQMGKRHGKP